MSNLNERMTFDTLSSVYRVEKSSATLSAVRKDLYSAMADLLNSQVKECERIAATNIDSIMYDGAAERKKKINQLIRKIVEMRTQKITDMAIRGAMGSNIVIDALTEEEKIYYQTIIEASRQHLSLANCKKKVTIPDVTNPTAIRTETRKEEPAPVVKEPEPVAVQPVEEEIPIQKEEIIPEPAEEEAIPVGDIPIDDFPPEEEMEEIPEDEEPFFPEEKPAEKEEPVIESPPIKPVELPENTLVIIRILEDIPRFCGPDREYELVKEDIVRMPSMMAAALINRGIAALVSMS